MKNFKKISLILLSMLLLICSMTTSAIVSAEAIVEEYMFSTDFETVTGATSYDYTNGYVQIKSVKEGQELVFVSYNSLPQGQYVPTLVSRSMSARPKVDIYINDTLVAVDLDLSGTDLYENRKRLVPLTSIVDSITMSSTEKFTVKLVAKETLASNSQLFVNGINFERVDDTSNDVALSMIKGASMRLTDEAGIRFYTKADAEKISSLIDGGYTVELGTLIAKSEDVTVDNPLNFDNFTAGEDCYDVKFTAMKDGDFFTIRMGIHL